MSAPAGSRTSRTVLAARDFRRLLATRLVSQAGDGAFEVGLATLVFFSAEHATSAAVAASAFAVAILPYTLVGPFAGVLLDRWRRRQVLLVVNLARTLLAVVVALLVVHSGIGLPLSLLVLACLSLNRFFLAGLGASLPHVVRPDELVVANAIAPTAGTVAALLGAAAGYAVRHWAGGGDASNALVVLVAALAYLVAALLTLRMGRDLLGPRATGGSPADADRGRLTADLRGIVDGLVAGARHVRSRPPARNAFLVIALHRLAFGLASVATVLVCRYRLSDPTDPDSGLQVIAATVLTGGLGFGLAAVITPIATRRMPLRRWIVTCSAVVALAQGVLAFVLSIPVLLVSAFVIGIGVQASKICVDAILQSSSDDAFRGRVFSFYDAVYNAAFVAAAALAAFVLPPDGYSPPALLAMAALYALAAISYGRLSAREASPAGGAVDTRALGRSAEPE
jgi:MFS family permease